VAPAIQPKRTGPACGLTILQGMEAGKSIDLISIVRQSGRHVLTVGRGEDNVIPVADYQSFYTSRYHCTLEVGQDMKTVVIRDGQWNMQERSWRSSSNGTYVNSTEVSASGQTLQSGDIITIGEITLRFDS
jgi:pSer/pThr/pTyr-binding forkhead associated (FHA) protein